MSHPKPSTQTATSCACRPVAIASTSQASPVSNVATPSRCASVPTSVDPGGAVDGVASGSEDRPRGSVRRCTRSSSDDDRRRTGRRRSGRAGGCVRRLHTGPRPLVLPNAWNVASARSVVNAGFPVVATSSGAIAATLGYEDNDSMPVDEAFGVIARITRSVSVPVTADLEAGYGLSPTDLVERLLDAGAVGCNLEDTDHHGGARPRRRRRERRTATRRPLRGDRGRRRCRPERTGRRAAPRRRSPRAVRGSCAPRATLPSGRGRLRVPNTGSRTTS
jgi:hypothetical protein